MPLVSLQRLLKFFNRLRKQTFSCCCAHVPTTTLLAVVVLSFADIHLLKVASIGVGFSLFCWKCSLISRCACQVLFLLFYVLVWLIIPAGDYSLKCLGTRKQAYLKKICNVRLLLVTEHIYIHKQVLDKNAMHLWKNNSSLKWTLRGLCGLVKHFFNAFLKEHIEWDVPFRH